MKTKAILLGALAITTLAGCNNENDHIADGPQNATFTASISGQKNTRAYDRTWENGDAIGITGTSHNKEYTNIRYTTVNGDGTFTVATPGQEIYYQDNNEVSFTAYYPQGESTDITASTVKQENQKQFDFLYGTGTGSKASPNVALAFNHQMTKLVLTIQKGADVSYAEVQEAKLSLGGFLHVGTFNGLTGVVEATGEEATNWCFAGNANTTYNAPRTLDANAETVSYTLILFPQVFATTLPFEASLEGRQEFKANLDFTAANRAAGDEHPGNYWTGGRQYNMSIKLNKTGITVEGCTITEWNVVSGGDPVEAQ